MSDLTTPTAVLSWAVEEEERAAGEYRELANEATDERCRRIFESLALEEEQHAIKLHGVKLEGELDLDLDLVEQMAAAEVAHTPESGPELDYAGALRLAINNEWLAYRLYSGLARYATEEEVRRLLNGLAEEEARHHKTLQSELELLEQVSR